jgi:hypothetical protein
VAGMGHTGRPMGPVSSCDAGASLYAFPSFLRGSRRHRCSRHQPGRAFLNSPRPVVFPVRLGRATLAHPRAPINIQVSVLFFFSIAQEETTGSLPRANVRLQPPPPYGVPRRPLQPGRSDQPQRFSYSTTCDEGWFRSGSRRTGPGFHLYKSQFLRPATPWRSHYIFIRQASSAGSKAALYEQARGGYRTQSKLHAQLQIGGSPVAYMARQIEDIKHERG